MDKKKILKDRMNRKRQILKDLRNANGCKRRFLLRELEDVQTEIDEWLKDGG